MDKKYIYVYDASTVAEFINAGFELVRDGRNDGVFIFSNDNSLKFEKIKGYYTFTNTLLL